MKKLNEGELVSFKKKSGTTKSNGDLPRDIHRDIHVAKSPFSGAEIHTKVISGIPNHIFYERHSMFPSHHQVSFIPPDGQKVTGEHTSFYHSSMNHYMDKNPEAKMWSGDKDKHFRDYARAFHGEHLSVYPKDEKDSHSTGKAKIDRSMNNFHESTVPVNNASSGNVAGLGDANGEPGVPSNSKKKKSLRNITSRSSIVMNPIIKREN